MQVINNNSKKVCFVVGDENTLEGVLTDGDIRRAILLGNELQNPVSKILVKDYVYGQEQESISSLLKKLNKKIYIIPIVDKKNIVVDYMEHPQTPHYPVALPTLNGNEFKYLTDAFFSTWVSSKGRYIDKFEEGFSKYSECKHGVAVSNGTAALHLAISSLDIGLGDEVIVPDLTFAATINAVIHSNATPVIVDIELDSWCIDPISIESAITKKTKAIIPVHLFGQPCNMDAIMKIARKYKLKVIEDCAEAHGATYNGKKVGSFGDVGCFSFYGNKIITTGEGGMCTTNSKKLSAKMQLLRDHGMNKVKKYWHDMVGFNYRMTNLQAAIGLAQLERIDNILKNRRAYEDGYKKILKKNFVFQQDYKNKKRVTWLVSLLVEGPKSRDYLVKKFVNNGIDARPFFYPLSDMDIYKSFCNTYTINSHTVSKKGLSLPTYESLKSIEKIKQICQKIKY